MQPRPWVLIFLIAFSTVPAPAQQVCPCVPIGHEWIVQECPSWNCAAAATVMANGDPDVLPMPSGSDDFKWVVIRRVAVGSAIGTPNGPFRVETFSALATAMPRFESIDPDLQPFLFTTAEGQVLIVSRNIPQPRRRTTAR